MVLSHANRTFFEKKNIMKSQIVGENSRKVLALPFVFS